MKDRLTLLLIVALVALTASGRRLSSLHVSGNQLCDAKGRTVRLHGVMDTPNPYFNSHRWGYRCDDKSVGACISYFDKLCNAITDNRQGAFCNVLRLHLDPCWTNDPALKSNNKEKGEADISRFSEARLAKYLDTLYLPIIQTALRHGLYVVVRPPGVCPHNLRVGDDYQRYLETVWGMVARHPRFQKLSGVVSLELANEPVDVRMADGSRSPLALHDYFQPIVDRIRRNGFKGIIWIPGAGYQSQYADYASHPITDSNFGYAVHVYPGWYGASDEHCDHEAFIRQFHQQVPVVDTQPIIVTEIDWSPIRPGAGKRNEFGQWVPSNLGTWATASTSKWGNAWKAVLDHYSNISMTLSGTDVYIDVPCYLSTKKVKPAFDGNTEACGAACFQWYREMAKTRNNKPNISNP